MSKKRNSTLAEEVQQEEVQQEEVQQEEVQQEETTSEEFKGNDGVIVDEQSRVEAEQETINEKPIVVEKTEEQPQVVRNPVDEVRAILSENITFEEKIAKIEDLNLTAYRTLISKLKGYGEAMSTVRAVDPKFGASKNFDLYTTLKNIVSVKDYKEFKVKFDIINLWFKANSKDAYAWQNLQRFDDFWTWGDNAKSTYKSLAHIIPLLADKSTREVALQTKVNLDNALNKNVFSMDDLAIENIKKYYTA